MAALRKLLTAAAILGLAAPPVAAQEMVDQNTAPVTASVADLTHGGETCSVGKRQERKMLEHFEQAGYEPRVSADLETRQGLDGRRDPAGLTVLERNGVTLSYFHSTIMRSCTAEGLADADFTIEALLAELTLRLGKEPKVDTPGKKYLFGISGAILTVQVNQADGETTVSLATVRT